MSVPSRFCPNCGKPVAMEAKFCPSCGATIPQAQAMPPVPAPAPTLPQSPAQPAYPSYGPAYQTPYQQPYQQQPPKKSNTKIIIAVVIIIIVVVAGLGTYAAYTFFQNLPNLTNQKSFAIANGAYSVPPSKYYYFNFTLPTTAILINVNGTFTSTGGVQVLVMDDPNYISYHNGQTANYYYNSGSTTSGTIIASLPTAGLYHLVYANIAGTTITVTTTATAYYR